MFIRSHYNYDVEAASNESAYTECMPSLTVQSMSDEADLNFILKRFGVTGKMPENVRLPTYGDFSEVTDFRSAMEAILEAQDNFMALPADVRAKFDNDPQLLLDFSSNPANIEQVKVIFGEKNVSANVGGQSAPNGGAVGTAAGSPGGASGGNSVVEGSGTSAVGSGR